MTRASQQHTLLVGLHINNGTHELDHVLLKLQVVGVDLARTLRSEDNQRVLGIDVLQQIVNGRGRDAHGLGNNSGHACIPLSGGFR